MAYRRSLKEDVLDVPKQTCITKDNVSVDIDGVLYLQVVNPEKSAYGISDYMFGSVQLAQTALRSAIGKLELDRTFEERSTINQEVISALDAATAPWGIKVLRYEIRDITPPSGVMQAMEKQMRAEREKRALIAQSEGEMPPSPTRWKSRAVRRRRTCALRKTIWNSSASSPRRATP